MALPMRLLPLALVAVLAAAGCGQGSNDSSGDFSGEQKAVAQTVEDLQDAGKKGDSEKICTDLLAPALVRTIRQASGDCAKVVDDALEDADSFDLDVQKVTINGNRATATVKSEAGNKDRTDTIALERDGRNWKIASLGGSAPAA
jgi:predicted lipid-binding transport protein (Tim44 family)